MKPEDLSYPECLAGYREGVYRLVLFLTQNAEAAHELTQETYAVALSKGVDPQKGEDYGAWLRSIARNLVLKYREKQGRKWLVFSSEIMELAKHRFVRAGAERDEQWESLRNALLSCIQKLPETGRTLLLRRYELGERVKQMASDIGIEPRSLTKRFMSIRRSLRDCINSVMARRRSDTPTLLRGERDE